MDLPIIERTDPWQTLFSTIDATNTDGYRLLEIQLNSLGVQALNTSPHKEVHNIFSNGYFEDMLFKIIMSNGDIAKTRIVFSEKEASGVSVQDVENGNKVWLRLPPPFNTVLDQ